MRLIDADAIEHCLVIGGRRHGKAIISEFIRRAIQTAPTVDAIPMDWIEQWEDKNPYAELGDMLNDWKDESEKRTCSGN